MIDTRHDLRVVRQAQLLEISHFNVYYLPRPVSQADLVLMRRIDELHLNFPFAGARMLLDMLKLEGFAVSRKRRGFVPRAICHWATRKILANRV